MWLLKLNCAVRMGRPIGPNVDAVLRCFFQIKEHAAPEDTKKRGASKTIENVGYSGVSTFVAVAQDCEDRAEDCSETFN